MSQRVLRGPATGRLIAVVREHGDRLECVCLLPWFFVTTLEHISTYWLGDWSTHVSLEPSVLEMLR